MTPDVVARGGRRVAGRPLGFGVVGATSMVHRLAWRPAILATDGVRLVHEASRTPAALPRLDGVRRSQDYESVLADDEVDVVYVPLPNHLHERWVLACAAAGKHVVCEKPLAVDAAAARRMAAACDEAGVVLLEAYMSPFHPRSAAVLDAVADGALGGRLRHAEARFDGLLDEGNHRWSAANGGGALLDLGIYCLEPMLAAWGWDGEEQPVEVAASSRWRGDPDGDGVDEATAALLTWADGTTMTLHVDFAGPERQRLELVGPDAAIEVPERMATPGPDDGGYLRRNRDGAVSEVPTDAGDPYAGLAAHVRDVLVTGVAPRRSTTRSVATAGLLDLVAASSRDVTGS